MVPIKSEEIPHSLLTKTPDETQAHVAGATEPNSPDHENGFLHGARFWMVAILNGVMLFLVQAEISVVTTSLVVIARDLGGFEISNWVMSGYLFCLVVIVSKSSDIFGRKPAVVTCIFLFTVFSGGCAAAQTMPQLIILRAFQGLGGGGCYALSTILIIEIVPPHKYSTLVAYTGIAIVLAMVLGPIIGGAIVLHTTWRWIFLFNIPVGALGLVLAVLGIPNRFPHQNKPVESVDNSGSIAKLDSLGCVLVLLATMSITSAFQEAGSRFAWSSSYVISLLVVSFILWVILVIWERRVTKLDGARQPILPWRLLINPAMVGVLIGLILLGGPLTVTTLQLPQRFQLINGLSSLDAGVRLIPFGGAVPVGTIVGGKLATTFKVPAIYVLILGASLQVLGFALLGTVKPQENIVGAIYGYQVIAGLGCGVSFQTLLLAIPFILDKRDQAVGLGTAIQCRAMGSAIIVAVSTSVFNDHVLTPLRQVGASDLIAPDMTQDRAGQLSPESRAAARNILSEGYNRQMLVLCACGAAQVLMALMMWRRQQIRLVS